MTSGDQLPEPVSRYLTHSLPSGYALPPGVELTMSGRIKVGVWLPFVATQRCDGKSFVWRSRLGPDLAPEHVEVHLHIAPDGRLVSLSAQRWGEVTKGAFGYHQFGGDVHEEQRFGPLVLPRRLTAGWGYGTDKYVPFFKATITAAKPL